jgi:hypothetical protein
MAMMGADSVAATRRLITIPDFMVFPSSDLEKIQHALKHA